MWREALQEAWEASSNEQIGGGERESRVCGQEGKSEPNAWRCEVWIETVLPVVCLQGENNMRKAHFNIPSFGNKSKQLDHTGSTSCPKPDFNYHFLNNCTQL